MSAHIIHLFEQVVTYVLINKNSSTLIYPHMNN